MFVILRGAHARFERGGRPASADDTCCPLASAEILRGSCAADWGRRLRPLRLDRALCALRACLPAHFFAALRGANPDASLRGKVGALRRSLLRQMPDALTGGGLACAAFAFGALPGAGAARPSCRARIPAHRWAFACERREAAFPAMFRRRHERRRSAAERSPDFPAFPAGWRKVMRRGKGGAPARSRKRAECGRPGLPHSG